MPIAAPSRLNTRVALSSIRPEDSRTLFRWINDPETVRFNAAYKPVHWAGHEEWCRSLGAATNKQVFAIHLDERLIGVVQLIDIDPVHRSAELIVRIGEEADRGRGYGMEALRLATDFAWRDLNLHRAWLRVFANNARAIGAYRKAGFTESTAAATPPGRFRRGRRVARASARAIPGVAGGTLKRLIQRNIRQLFRCSTVLAPTRRSVPFASIVLPLDRRALGSAGLGAKSLGREMAPETKTPAGPQDRAGMIIRAEGEHEFRSKGSHFLFRPPPGHAAHPRNGATTRISPETGLPHRAWRVSVHHGLSQDL